MRTNAGTVFDLYSLGVTTNRDAWVYNFHLEAVGNNMRRMIEAYNAHVARWQSAAKAGAKLDDWVEKDDSKIAWSRDLKVDLTRGKTSSFSERAIRRSLYRPFSAKFLYLDRIMNEEPRCFEEIFPDRQAEAENRAIVLSDHGHRSVFSALAVGLIPECHLCAPTDAFQSFPFYTYDPDGSNRRENLTDWTLSAFREHYGEPAITKWEIFHYIYAILHHAAYRERYAANLKRKLPHIPFAPEFRPFAEAGARLAELHVNYEQQAEYPLNERWKPGAPLDLRVERMKWDSAAGEIVYNHTLTLTGIPHEVERYRLGHKSALGWVVDQYQVSTDKRSGIVDDPNREDDPKAILRLIGQVITVSLETVRIVEALPDLGLPTG
jgi:predicted helicase